MKKMIKIGLLSLGLAVAQTGFSADSALPKMSNSELQQAYEGFQNDADIVRLKHLQYWVNLIEEYHAKTGKYPFQDEANVPIYVIIATPRQQIPRSQMPKDIVTKSMHAFVKTLETGLGRTINEYYDPQFEKDYKPNFYMYMINKGVYNFAIHTHQRYYFGKNIAPNYNKVEVSNVYNPSANLIVTPTILFDSDYYKEMSQKPLQKPKFFAEREQQTLHQTKQSQ